MTLSHLRVLASIGLAGLLMGRSSALAQTAPSLGRADSYAVLADSAVTSKGSTVLVGKVGVSPGTSISGFPPGTATGGLHSNDADAQGAKTDLTTAYNSLAGQACGTDLTGQPLGGKTLTAGVYCFDMYAGLADGETLTLDAQGLSNRVFIFQMRTLGIGDLSNVTVINSPGGGSSEKIFWQVRGSASLGISSNFIGNILAETAITLRSGARVTGRLLSLTRSVTLDTNAVSLGYGPASVDLLAFNAQRLSRGVRLSWSTGSEFGCASFKVLRSVMGKRMDESLAPIELSPDAIPCRRDAAGSAYEIEDRSARPDASYSYFLRQYDSSGGQRQFGPLVLSAGEARSSFSPK